MPVNPSMIFDLGLYEGQDTRFYLDKGFTVIGLEAHPQYAKQARQAFASEIGLGRFHLVERALWHEADRTIEFHLQGAQSSITKEFADSSGASVPVEVVTTTLACLLSQFGTPYYLKCDLEGADELVIGQLQTASEKPLFISVESASHEAIGSLAGCGYDRFQIVNQGYHARTKIPFPAREGEYAEVRLNDTMSGLFGRELDPDHWMPLQMAVSRMKRREYIVSPNCPPWLRYLYRRIGKARSRLDLVAQGWTDVHACHHSSLIPRSNAGA